MTVSSDDPGNVPERLQGRTGDREERGSSLPAVILKLAHPTLPVPFGRDTKHPSTRCLGWYILHTWCYLLLIVDHINHDRNIHDLVSNSANYLARGHDGVNERVDSNLVVPHVF